jgi:hypothetical protein
MKVSNWKRIDSGALVGSFTAELSNGINIDCQLFRRDGRAWVTPRSAPMIDKAGQHMIGDNGKKRYQAIVAFATKEIGSAFGRAAIAALKESGINATEPVGNGGDDGVAF